MTARGDMQALFDKVHAEVASRERHVQAPWTGCHNGRKAEAFTSADVYVGDVALYMPSSAPDGALAADRANRGWASAWSRRNTTRAGKSERRSMLVGSQRGARRGECE